MKQGQQKKRFYWLKLKDNFFTDPRMKKLRKMAGGNTYTVILLKIMLETLKSDGVLIYEGIEDTLSEELSLKLDEEEIDVSATLMFMEKMKLIEEISRNQYLLPEVVKIIGSEVDSAERVRRFRARKKTKLLQCNMDETIGNKYVTTEKEKELEKEPLSKSLSIKNQENYPDFRKRIIRTYQNKIVLRGSIKVTDMLTYTDKVTISINDVGYLVNDYIGEELTYEAKPLWRWMYVNQDRLEPIT